MEFAILMVLLSSSAYLANCLRCFSCNSGANPGVCDYHGNLTTAHSQHIVECQGTCKYGTLRDDKEEVHLRMCQPNQYKGCDKTTLGFLCQCSTDFCNKDLATCHKASKCTQSIDDSLNQSGRPVQSSNVKVGTSREAEFQRINRSITIFGTVIGCLVGLVLLVLFIVIVFKFSRKKRSGRVLHQFRATCSFHRVNTIPVNQAPPPTYQDVTRDQQVPSSKDGSSQKHDV